jgi:hypothetical protein
MSMLSRWTQEQTALRDFTEFVRSQAQKLVPSPPFLALHGRHRRGVLLRGAVS